MMLPKANKIPIALCLLFGFPISNLVEWSV
jgi:hypothetical protein